MTWSVSFGYYTCLVLPYSAFDYSNDGMAGCEPTPHTGVLMLVSTCLLYFPTTMILLYVYGTVFHSNHVAMSRKHNSCNDQCTSCYCNVSRSPNDIKYLETLKKNLLLYVPICNNMLLFRKKEKKKKERKKKKKKKKKYRSLFHQFSKAIILIQKS